MKQTQEQQVIRPKTAPQRVQPKAKTTPIIQAQIDAATLLQLQRTVGNNTLQRFADSDSFTVEDDLATQIRGQMGQGATIGATPIAQNVSALTGVDVTDTHVHRESELPAQVGAKAMAVGDTVFVGAGHDSAETVGHELAHIAQNKTGNAPAVQASGLAVTAANSPYEDYADAVGQAASQNQLNTSEFALQRTTAEEDALELQRQGLEEDLELSRLQRADLEEEDPTLELQREVLAEEDNALELQRTELNEEEMV